MRTKRGGYKTAKPKTGTPRVRLRGSVKAAGDFIVDLKNLGRLTDRQRIAAVTGAVSNWRDIGPMHAIEPLDAGLRRYLGVVPRSKYR